MNQINVAKNEHTMNIRAGLSVLKTMYTMHMDEYDYIDIAVDTLRNIKHFGITEYVSYITVNSEGKAVLPCNMDTVDAVTTQEMGIKAFSERVKFEMDGIVNTDTFYTMQGIMNNLGVHVRSGFAGGAGKGYIAYSLEGGFINVSKEYAGKKIALAFTGITTDLEGLPIITRKQSNALAAVAARVLAVRGANRGDKGLASMVEYYTGVSARLTQAASIPEDFSDNELDEVLNAKTSFNKKSYNRPTKYSR
jgi:hypothetical protein